MSGTSRILRHCSGCVENVAFADYIHTLSNNILNGHFTSLGDKIYANFNFICYKLTGCMAYVHSLNPYESYSGIQRNRRTDLAQRVKLLRIRPL